MSKNKITSGERTLITCQDAAKLYGCTMRYIRKLAQDGRIYSQSVGRAYLVDAAEIKKLAAAGGSMSKGFAAK